MTFNSEQIIQEIHAEFEQMLDLVTNDAAQQATADQMERGLFTQLLRLGRQLLLLFFVLRSQQSQRRETTTAEGERLPYHQDRKRDYLSIFGKVPIWRPYFYKRGIGSAVPLDAELSLGKDSYSDMLREMAEYLEVYGVYHKVADVMKRFFNLHLSTRTLQDQVLTDAEDVLAYYEQKPAPQPDAEAEVLVIQADGKGVPIIMESREPQPVRLGKGQKRGRKKEAIVTTAYTIGAAPRTPEAVLRSYYSLKTTDEPSQAEGAHTSPQNKHVWATLEGKDTALGRLAHHVLTREGSHIHACVALCDGCEALQTRITSHFPDYVQILDFVHANEYLWDVANALFGEDDSKRLPWMIQHTRQLLSGKPHAVIEEFRTLAVEPTTTARQREQLHKTANYFERNLRYMDYVTYLARGWPIASGVIEGACRHFVKDRCELSGMRWSLTGAEQLLRLRAVAENDDWEAYHAYRKRKRHERLYDQSYPLLPSMEMLTLSPEMVAVAA
jgi:hypothetical protein